MKIYPFFCIISGLSVVQMNPLNIKGRVGENVTISCSGWDVWTNVKTNVKYFCSSPCTENQHIIIEAAHRERIDKDRIRLFNQGETLFVTFSNLQKSDSKTYYCGVERDGLLDAYIGVILNVTDALSPSPRMTPKTVVVVPTSSFAVTKNSTMSSNSSDVITGSVLYWVVGVTSVLAVITILMVSLKFMNKMTKQRLNVVSGANAANTDAQEAADPDGVYHRQSLHPLTMDKDQVYNTITPNKGEGPSTSTL